jgi:hypothetical protein
MIEMDSSAFLAKLNEIADKLPGAAQQGLNKAGEQAVQIAKSSGLFKNRTGKLTSSIKFQVSGTAFERIVSANAKNAQGIFYGNYVNYGNDPGGGKIYPTKAKALRFEIDGQVFFRKWVRAAAPRPFFTNMATVLPNVLYNNLFFTVATVIS